MTLFEGWGKGQKAPSLLVPKLPGDSGRRSALPTLPLWVTPSNPASWEDLESSGGSQVWYRV